MGVVLGKLIITRKCVLLLLLLLLLKKGSHWLLLQCDFDNASVLLGSEEPFERMRPALMLYVKEDLLHGNPDSHENLKVRIHMYWDVLFSFFFFHSYGSQFLIHKSCCRNNLDGMIFYLQLLYATCSHHVCNTNLSSKSDVQHLQDSCTQQKNVLGFWDMF